MPSSKTQNELTATFGEVWLLMLYSNIFILLDFLFFVCFCVCSRICLCVYASLFPVFIFGFVFLFSVCCVLLFYIIIIIKF